MEIIRGKIAKAQKVVIYGPEGIGKSTLAAQFPDPLFIDTEGSTNNMDVARLQPPSSLTMLLDEVEFVKKERPCSTLVIDTADWVERLVIEYVCNNAQKTSITQFGYGEGYIQLEEKFGKLLNLLSDLIDVGINVVVTAHAKLNKFEQPDEMGAYDRYELKLGNKTTAKTASLLKEWADMVLFCNYKTYSVATDDKGKKFKGQGGRRVVYTTHHPAWDAKNRVGLPDEIEMDYANIAHVFTAVPKVNPVTATETEQPKEAQSSKDELKEEKTEAPNVSDFMNIPPDTDEEVPFSPDPAKSDKVPELFRLPETIPKALRDLMEVNLVSEEELQKVVSSKGYFPLSTPIVNYGSEFINGVLVGAWEQVYEMVKKLRDTYEIPFNN